MKRLLINIFLAIFSTILFLGILEFSASLINKHLLSEKLQLTDLRTKLEQAYIPPFAEKEEDRLRVFVYGGSTVQGLPLEKVGLVSQLDYQLHQVLGETRNIEVFNLGWSGYNSTMIRYLISQTIKEKPDLLVIYTGHNEFIYPQLDFYELLKALTVLKNKTAFAKMFLVLKEDSQKKQESLDEKVNKERPAFRKQTVFYPLKMLLFRENMKAIVKMAREEKIPLVICTPASNLANWPPVDRKVTTLSTPDDYQQKFSQAKDLINQGKFDETNSLVNEVLDKYQDDASFLFLKAKVASESGQPEAGDLFVKAKDNDLIPWRSSTEQNDFIRLLADEEYVWVADTEEMLNSLSPNNLTGFSYIIDNVHPTKEGNYLIVKTIIELLKEKKFVKPEWWQETQDYLTMDEFLERVKYEDEDEFKLNFSTAKYSLKNPFFNFSTAKDYLSKAEEIEQNWQTKALWATIAFLENDKEAAESYLKEAEELNKAPLSGEQTLEIPYLNQFIVN